MITRVDSTENMSKTSISRRSIPKESLSKDSLSKASLSKESLSKDSMSSLSISSDSSNHEQPREYPLLGLQADKYQIIRDFDEFIVSCHLLWRKIICEKREK